MIVRFAKLQDQTQVVAMMPKASAVAGFGPNGPMPLKLTKERAIELFQLHLNHPDACCIVLEVDEYVVGFLQAAVLVHPFDPSVRIGKDTNWYIEEEHRGSLKATNDMLTLYEDWGAARTCQFVGIAGMRENPRIGVLLKRRDYFVAETHFLKRLGA